MLHASSLGLPFLPVRLMQGSGLMKFWGISEEKRKTMPKIEDLKCACLLYTSDYHAETRALTRLLAAKATGVLRFSAPSAAMTDYEIDAGSVAMTSGGVRFETTEKAVLSKGESHVDVPAIAVEAGANGRCV